MSEKRMIECPVCCGLSRCDGTNSLSCHRCGSSGTIPDRRRATPNDRAVERIKEYLRHRIDHVLDGNSYDDINAFFEVNVVLDIIREEAERER